MEVVYSAQDFIQMKNLYDKCLSRAEICKVKYIYLTIEAWGV